MDQLRELQDEDEPDLVAELAHTMEEETPPLLARAEDAARRGDAGELVRAAHRIKGSALSLGASRLADAAAAVERAAKLRGAEAAAPEVPAMRAEFDRFVLRAASGRPTPGS